MDEEKEMNYFEDEDQGLAVMIGPGAVLGADEDVYFGVVMDSSNCINVAKTCCS